MTATTSARSVCVLEAGPNETGPAGVTRTRLRTVRAIRRALARRTRKQTWVLRSEHAVNDLLRALLDAAPVAGGARLICYARATGPQVRIIGSRFARTLATASARVPFDDLVEILGATHPEDYCVGVDRDASTGVLALWRGDLSTIVVHAREFPARAGVSPDLDRLSIRDCGQTIGLGEYEVSIDAVLFERDPLYRRRAKKRMIATEQGLGPSIRRLRISRGLTRADFDGIDEKTLARIEHGNVTRPHDRTLHVIATNLGVRVSDLDDY